MPVDTSMYAPVQQPNFLDQAAKMAQTQALINQNKLFPGQQTLQGQAVAGGQVAVDKSKLDLAHQQYEMFNNQIGSLALDPNLTPEKVMAAGQNWVKQGMITQQMYDEEIKNMPKDPAQLGQYMKTVQMRVLDGQQKMQQVYGSPIQTNNGQEIKPGAISPVTGYHPLEGGAIKIQQTPAELAAPASLGVDKAGVPRVGTSEQFQEQVTGKNPITGQPVVAPAPIKTALPPGEAEAAQLTQQENAKAGVKLQQTADQVPQRLAILDEMETQAKGFEGGEGLDTETLIKRFANRYGFDIDTQGVAAKEQFDKLAKQIAAQQAQGMGEGTDYKLGFMSGANPNSGLSNVGIKGIIHLLKGNEDALNVKNQAWQEWKTQNGPGSYDTFSTAFNKAMDPRVFQFARMDPTERAIIIQGMATKGQKPGTYNDQQKGFFNKLKLAQSYGWVKPNGQ